MEGARNRQSFLLQALNYDSSCGIEILVIILPQRRFHPNCLFVGKFAKEHFPA